MKKNNYVVCLDPAIEDICDGGKLKETLVVPSSGCKTVLLVKVYIQVEDSNCFPGWSLSSLSTKIKCNTLMESHKKQLKPTISS